MHERKEPTTTLSEPGGKLAWWHCDTPANGEQRDEEVSFTCGICGAKLRVRLERFTEGRS